MRIIAAAQVRESREIICTCTRKWSS